MAVIITCHNRVTKTLACLSALASQRRPDNLSLKTFLLDDGSSDGTSEAVARLHPEVHLLRGNGQLFWNGGMRVAFDAAMQAGFDYYLWLNDDTLLFGDALVRLLRASADAGPDSIIVGTTVDPDDMRTFTYGGVCRVSSYRLKFRLVDPAFHDRRECDTFNGNCVLIPHAVAAVAGGMYQGYTHGMGDYDYGLHAQRSGFHSFVAPGVFGTCKRNSVIGTWRDETLPWKNRRQLLLGQKGLPPREWFRFCLRFGGSVWPMLFLAPYAKFCARSLWGWFSVRDAGDKDGRG